MLKLSVGRLVAFAVMSALASAAGAADVLRADLTKAEMKWDMSFRLLKKAMYI